MAIKVKNIKSYATNIKKNKNKSTAKPAKKINKPNNKGQKNTPRSYESVLRKTLIAVLVLTFVMVLNVFPFSSTKSLIGGLKNILSYEVNYDEWANFGEIKRVSMDLIRPVLGGFISDSNLDGLETDNPDNGNPVINLKSNLTFEFPAKGEIIDSFELQSDEQLTDGVLIKTEDNLISAAEVGTVSEVIQSRIYGSQVIIIHDENYKTVYDLVDEVYVAVGDTVTKGQNIGTSDQFFYFQIFKDDLPLDIKSMDNIVYDTF